MKTAIHRPTGDRAETMVAATSAWVPAKTADVLDADPAVLGAPLFDGLDRAEIRTILGAFEEVRYPSSRRVVLEGLRGSDFFLLVSGSASVVVDGWRVARLGPGDFFGEMAVLGDGLRTASIRAETPLRCLVLPNGKLEQLLIDHPQLSLNLLRALVGRFAGVTGRRQPPAAEMIES